MSCSAAKSGSPPLFIKASSACGLEKPMSTSLPTSTFDSFVCRRAEAQTGDWTRAFFVSVQQAERKNKDTFISN